MCSAHTSPQARCSMVCIPCDDRFDVEEDSGTEVDNEWHEMTIDPAWLAFHEAALPVIKKHPASPAFIKQECLICLNSFQIGDALGTLQCHASHTFHFSCISEWHDHSRTCPLCRQ